MKTLSVVVPVFNAAHYLPSFLDSLVRQQRQAEEVIVVDDGSTDESLSIIYEYKDLLPLKVFQQQNTGCSVARNLGMDNAKGKYLMFLDADDILEPTLFDRVLDEAESYELDMVLYNANYFFEGRKPDKLIYNENKDIGVIEGNIWLKKQLSKNTLLHMVWMHLYRRDFILKNGFRYIPGIFHQDVIWTTEVLLAAKRIKFLADPLYQYRVLQRRLSPEQLDKRLKLTIDSSLVNLKALSKLAQKQSDIELEKLINFQAVDGGFAILHRLEQLSGVSKNEYKKKLKKCQYFKQMWDASVSLNQKRKIMTRWLKFHF